MFAYIECASILRPADKRRSRGVSEFDIPFEDLIAIRPESQVATLGIWIDEQTLDRLEAILRTVKTSEESLPVRCVERDENNVPLNTRRAPETLLQAMVEGGRTQV